MNQEGKKVIQEGLKKSIIDNLSIHYTEALKSYNEDRFKEFFNKIRFFLEDMGRIIIYDKLGPDDFMGIYDHKYKLENGKEISFNKEVGYEKIECSFWCEIAKRAVLYVLQREKTKNEVKSNKTNYEAIRSFIEGDFSKINGYFTLAGKEHHSELLLNDIEIDPKKAAEDCLDLIPQLINKIDLSDSTKMLFADLPKRKIQLSEEDKYQEKRRQCTQRWEDIITFTNGFDDVSTKCILLAPQTLSVENNVDPSFWEPLFRIHWSMVIDYNPDNESGLHKLVPKYLEDEIKIIKENFSDISEGIDTTHWLFANGQESDPKSIDDARNESKNIRALSDAISSMLNAGGLSNIIFVCLSSGKSVLKLLNAWFQKNPNKTDNTRVISISEEETDFTDSFEEKLDFAGFPKQNLRNVILPMAFLLEKIKVIKQQKSDNPDIGITSCRIRTNKGLEDYYCKYRKLFLDAGLEILIPNSYESTQLNKGAFYRGERISWEELECNYDAHRDKYEEIFNSIDSKLKKPGITECIINARPGSGATTIVRRIGYEIFKRSQNEQISRPCIVVFLNKYTSNTISKIENISQRSSNTKILLIAESEAITLKKLQNGIEEPLNRSNKNVTILYVNTVTQFFGCGSSNESTDKFSLSEILTTNEKTRFSDIYIRASLDQGKAKSLQDKVNVEVLDYPMTLAEDKEDVSMELKTYVKNISLAKIRNCFDVSMELKTYVKNWLECLPPEIKEFCAYISFCSLYSSIGYINENLFKSVFSRDSAYCFSLIKRLKNKEKEALEKILLCNRNLEGKPLPFWKPRYSPFGIFILECVWPNWKSRIHEIAIEVIKIIVAKSKYEPLPTDDMNMLYSLFVERRDRDYRNDYSGHFLLNNFSNLIEDIKISDRAESVLRELKNAFPKDPYFAAHFARFLFEKAKDNIKIVPDDTSYVDASKNIDTALALNPDSDELYHIKGMYFRRIIQSLRHAFDAKEPKYKEGEECIRYLMEWTDDGRNAFDESINISPNSPYGYVSKCQLYLQTITDYKKYASLDNEDFLEEDYFMELVEDFGKTVDVLSTICERYITNPDKSEYFQQTARMNENLRLKYTELIGDDRSAVDRYRKKLLTANSKNVVFYRQLFCDALIYSKFKGKRYINQAYSKLTPSEKNELEKVLEDRRISGDVYAFEKLFKLKKYSNEEYVLDDALNLFLGWEQACLSSDVSGYQLLMAKYLIATKYATIAL